MKSSILLVLVCFHAVDGQNGQSETCETPAEGSCERCEVPVPISDFARDFPNCQLPDVGDISLCHLDDGVVLCSASQENIECHIFSSCCLHTKYPGRFLTRQMHSEIHNLPYVDDATPTPMENLCPTHYNSDDDRCCETCSFFSEAPGVVKVDGKKCIVVHFYDMNGVLWHQYVPGAVCGTTGICYQNGCVKETTLYPLLCWQLSGSKKWWVDKIAYYKTAAYCSCKNVKEQENIDTCSGGKLEPSDGCPKIP